MKQKIEMIALVDCVSIEGTEIGMMLGLHNKENDFESIFNWVKGLTIPPGATLNCVTIVKPHKKKIDNPYIHPPMGTSVRSDGAVITPKGPVWFELVFSLSGEEE
jgi:hypothetical protein